MPNLIDKYMKIFFEILIGILFVYLAIEVFIALAQALWTLSPATSIGFVISVIIAFLKGEISFEGYEKNAGVILTIGIGTILSYAASAVTDSALSMLKNVWISAVAGNFVGAIIMLGVIVILWAESEEIKEIKFR